MDGGGPNMIGKNYETVVLLIEDKELDPSFTSYHHVIHQKICCA